MQNTMASSFISCWKDFKILRTIKITILFQLSNRHLNDIFPQFHNFVKIIEGNKISIRKVPNKIRKLQERIDNEYIVRVNVATPATTTHQEGTTNNSYNGIIIGIVGTTEENRNINHEEQRSGFLLPLVHHFLPLFALTK